MSPHSPREQIFPLYWWHFELKWHWRTPASARKKFFDFLLHFDPHKTEVFVSLTCFWLMQCVIVDWDFSFLNELAQKGFKKLIQAEKLLISIKWKKYESNGCTGKFIFISIAQLKFHTTVISSECIAYIFNFLQVENLVVEFDFPSQFLDITRNQFSNSFFEKKFIWVGTYPKQWTSPCCFGVLSLLSDALVRGYFHSPLVINPCLYMFDARAAATIFTPVEWQAECHATPKREETADNFASIPENRSVVRFLPKWLIYYLWRFIFIKMDFVSSAFELM